MAMSRVFEGGHTLFVIDKKICFGKCVAGEY
jgi:hypothetical protein